VQAGKLSTAELKRRVLGYLGRRRPEVLVHAGVGLDSAVIDLQGDLCAVSSDPITGAWEGESLWALAERIAMMPPTQPGMLSRDETVAILAYVLWFNGLPIGDAPLSTERSVLTEMAFHAPPLGGE